MLYIDKEKIYEDFIAVYSRVSTVQQDIQKQIQSAKAYITNHQINEDKLIWLEDEGFSANKLSTKEIPKLQELLMLIKQGKVKTIIVYHRDRLARNFYEYVALVKEFYKYEVKVIFTASNQPPFSKKLSIEALYGMFAQSDGMNISSRRSDTNKQFPSNIFGYQRIGKKKEVTYIPNPQIVHSLRSFFYEVIKVKSADDLFQVLLKYKKILNNKQYQSLLKYLNNPFYAAHMETIYGFEKLNHVTPIVSLDDFKVIQEVLKKLNEDLVEALTEATKHSIVTPHCCICKTEMTFRSALLGESGYYVCQKSHNKIKIEVSHLNNSISDHLYHVINSIESDKVKVEVSAYLNNLKGHNERKIVSLNRKLAEIHKEITERFSLGASTTKYEKQIYEARRTKKEIEEVHSLLIKIEDAKNHLKEYVQMVKNNLNQELQGYDLYFLSNLFFSKLEVSTDSIVYYVNFGKFIKDGGAIELNA